VEKLGMEGIIGKRRGSVYEPGARSGAWVKVKCALEQEFVIGGFTEPKGSRSDLGAIHVGCYEGKHFRYAGKVGTGFNRKLLAMLRAKLEPLIVKETPFTELPTKTRGRWPGGLTPAALRESTWVRPKLVCQVRFAEWTEDGSLRHPVFLGMREDKSPRDVVRERPQ
jgi:bifunctional non-homologous end joining protein LigD